MVDNMLDRKDRKKSSHRKILVGNIELHLYYNTLKYSKIPDRATEDPVSLNLKKKNPKKKKIQD